MKVEEEEEEEHEMPVASLHNISGHRLAKIFQRSLTTVKVPAKKNNFLKHADVCFLLSNI